MATKKTKPKSKASKSTQLTQFKFRWWMALVLVGVIAVIGILVLRYSQAGSRAYTIGELDDIYLRGRSGADRVGPYPDPSSPRGRELVKYTQRDNNHTWDQGCFVALTPEGARALSFKFGNPAHFSTRRWIQKAGCN